MSQIQKVKEASDIVEIISNRVTLQRAGSSLRGLCPFHGEKSPSFFVNESFQRYKCFGCGESGDVFNFLQKYDGMTFWEALSYLADRSGIELETFVKSQDDDAREELLGALSQAKEYYHYIFTTHQSGQKARDYAQKRGILSDSINTFKIGFAPEGWENLIEYLHGKKKVSLAILMKAGLIAKSPSGKYYDRFRSRLMFPLLDHRGRVVGFSGRVIDSSDPKQAKYINTPETELYHKSKMLFGYFELKQLIRKEKFVVVVEGELDVLSSMQARVGNVVAIKGSALSEDHARLIQRVASEVVLALDTDDAGIEATKKAIVILKKYNLDLKVIDLSDDKDPDEIAKKDPKKWRESVKSARSVYDFFIDVALKKFDKKSPEGKRFILKSVSSVINQIDHQVEKDHYIKILAQQLGVKVEAIVSDLVLEENKAKMKNASSSNKVYQDGFSGKVSSSNKVNVDSREINADNKDFDNEGFDHKSTKNTSKYRAKTEKLENHLTKMLLNAKISLVAEWLKSLDQKVFQSTALIQLIKIIQNNADFSASVLDLIGKLPVDIQQLLFAIYTNENILVIEDRNTAKQWQEVYIKVVNEYYHLEMKSLSLELKQLERQSQLSDEQQSRFKDILDEISQIKRVLTSIPLGGILKK